MIVESNMTSQNSNRRIAISLGAIVLVMVGLSYASVPLYDLFCRVTGYGGTTQVADVRIKPDCYGPSCYVRFDANINPALNWKFLPLESKVIVKSG